MIGLVNATARSIPLRDRAIHMLAMSPPYYGLRDYEVEGSDWPQIEFIPMAGLPSLTVPAWFGCLGAEPDPLMFVAHIVHIMREGGRVLRDDGTLWLNFGDSYVGGKGKSGHADPEKQKKRIEDGESFSTIHAHVGGSGETLPTDNREMIKKTGLKPKDMMGIPWRVAFALQADGWYLRSEIVWAKGNPMPESVNGWRWERHRIQVEKTEQATNSFQVGAYGSTKQGAGVASRAQREAYYAAEGKPMAARDGAELKDRSDKKIDCPGCEKCQANDGYVLRYGSWRPSSSHEHVFLFSKTERYFCDKDAVTEPLQESSIERISQPNFENQTGGDKDYGLNGVNTSRSMRKTLENFSKSVTFGGNKADGYGRTVYSGNEWDPEIDNGRNKRDVWNVNTLPYSGAHFATWPPALVEPMIKAGTSERGVCVTCGAPWVRVIHKSEPVPRPDNPNPVIPYTANSGMSQGTGETTLHKTRETKTEGWRPSCACDDTTAVPAIVLDMFVGSGTTLQVARQLGRSGIGLDLSFHYLKENAKTRLSLDLVEALENGQALESSLHTKRAKKPTRGQLSIFEALP